jgi:DNA polymerase, archaea type
LEIEFNPVDISYRVEHSEAKVSSTINLYGKSQEKQVMVKYTGFLPYFWVIPKATAEEAAAGLAGMKSDNADARILGTEIQTKRFLGKEIRAIRVIINLPSAIPDFREKAKVFGQPLEADIPFTKRFLIDKRTLPLATYRTDATEIDEKGRIAYSTSSLSQVNEEAPEFKILAIDIETHNPLGKNMLPEEHPIIMVGLYGDGFRKVITWKKFPTTLDFIEFVDSELELIEHMAEHIKQYQPDILTGYYSDVFDLPYIKTRADRYKIKLDLGLDGSQLKINKTPANTTSEIAGIVHLDVFKFIRKVMWSSLQTTSYDLDSVAKELLNENKEMVDIANLHLAWDNHDGAELEKFCSYNLQDAQLTYSLCKKVLPNIIELSRTIGLPLYDVSRMSYSQLVEWYLIRQAKEFNELAPNKPSNQEERSRIHSSYTGAFVYEPTPGLYKNIVVFDFMSLYPTIISSHNISPDTLNCECCKDTIQNKAPGEENIWFCTKQRGFIPSVIDELIKRRVRVKEIIRATGNDKTLNARQMALKTIANAMYGYFGFFGARWYCIECAKAITSFGRMHIQAVISEAKRNGYNVLYSDTDSIFMALDGKTKEDIKNLVENINSKLPGIMELDYEGFYPSGLFVGTKSTGLGAKKKYALLSENGTIKIRGFETVRRNLSQIAKDTQEKVLDMVLKENNPKAAVEYVKQIITEVRARTLPTDKVTITTQLQKEIGHYENLGPHVAAAKRMQEQGIPVGSGSVIKYVVVKGEERISDRARLPEEVKEGEYDPDYYINNQIIPAVEKIFDVFNYDSKELSAEKTQKKLDSFFG